MLALCSLTTAFFDVQALKKLELAFDEYPVFYELPQVGLSDLLPLESKQSWSQLTTLSLRYVPFRLSELRTLVRALGDSLEIFHGYCLYLLGGKWAAVLDTARGFERLRGFSLMYPRGGDLGNDRGFRKYPPENEVVDYVLKRSEKNPFPTFFAGLGAA
jgi:hypothetical protein